MKNNSINNIFSNIY